jgi:hypothetical protein
MGQEHSTTAPLAVSYTREGYPSKNVGQCVCVDDVVFDGGRVWVVAGAALHDCVRLSGGESDAPAVYRGAAKLVFVLKLATLGLTPTAFDATRGHYAAVLADTAALERVVAGSPTLARELRNLGAVENRALRAEATRQIYDAAAARIISTMELAVLRAPLPEDPEDRGEFDKNTDANVY